MKSLFKSTLSLTYPLYYFLPYPIALNNTSKPKIILMLTHLYILTFQIIFKF